MEPKKLYDLLFEAFCYGVDYGQLLMEEERENEGIFDAFLCGVSAKKYGVPSAPTRTRQVHSEKWFAAKRKSKADFLDMCANILEN
jgi:hypothetical protein